MTKKNQLKNPGPSSPSLAPTAPSSEIPRCWRHLHCPHSHCCHHCRLLISRKSQSGGWRVAPLAAWCFPWPRCLLSSSIEQTSVSYGNGGCGLGGGAPRRDDRWWLHRFGTGTSCAAGPQFSRLGRRGLWPFHFDYIFNDNNNSCSRGLWQARALSELASCIDLIWHEALLRSLFGMSMWHCGPSVMDAFIKLLISMAASSGKFIDVCLVILVSNFFTLNNKLHILDKLRGRLLKQQAFGRVHFALCEISDLVPLTPPRLDHIVYVVECQGHLLRGL